MKRRAHVLFVAAALAACSSRPAPEPWTEAWFAEEAVLYLEDAEHRREVLVSSFENPENVYSRTRIASYGLVDAGWDLLPEWNPRTEVVTEATAASLATGTPIEVVADPLWDGVTPDTTDDWIALGRKVFEGYPLRAEPLASWALAQPDAGASFGLEQTPDGMFPGLRAIVDLDGSTTVGITCALCHSVVENGEHIVGRARRSFDYGALWLAANEDLGIETEPDLAARLASWGPGRADISEDTEEDPVAIPDLWGLRHQTSLTQAGTLRHVSPATLAIRQETQLTHANHQRSRPPRVLAWALARFLYSLEPPAKEPVDDAEVTVGLNVFTAECARCHSNEALGGPIVAATVIGTDSALALGAGRGTGFYRPPALIRVADNAPYFHHGAVSSLEELFSADRLEDAYNESPLGPGPVPGHVYGLGLSESEHTSLLRYLGTL